MPLDIGIGLLLAFAIHSHFHVELSVLLITVGVASALLPDIDILTALLGRWRHRERTHYPLLYIPLAALAFLFAPLPYAWLFALGVLAHFIHDTIGTGWGISWLWPLTDRRFLLFPYRRQKEMGMVATWLPEEHPEWAHHGGHEWVGNLYFRPSLVAVIEYGLLALALLTLVYLW